MCCVVALHPKGCATRNNTRLTLVRNVACNTRNKRNMPQMPVSEGRSCPI